MAFPSVIFHKYDQIKQIFYLSGLIPITDQSLSVGNIDFLFGVSSAILILLKVYIWPYQ